MEKSIYKTPRVIEVPVYIKRGVCQAISGGELYDYNADTIEGGDDFAD